MYRPKYTKKDANQAQIISDCRGLGIYVWDISNEGGEKLDTVMFWKERAVPVEIKRVGYTDADFTEGERKCIERFKAMEIPFIVATSAEDVVNGWPTS